MSVFVHFIRCILLLRQTACAAIGVVRALKKVQAISEHLLLPAAVPF